MRHLFGGVNDLSGVSRKMLDNVVDRLEHRYIVILHAGAVLQPFGRQRPQNCRGLPHRGVQLFREFLRPKAAARSKLAVPLADVRPARDPESHPLADVSAQMQHEITHGVLPFRSASPDLLRREQLETGSNPSGELGQLLDGKPQEKLAQLRVHGQHYSPLLTSGQYHGKVGGVRMPNRLAMLVMVVFALILAVLPPALAQEAAEKAAVPEALGPRETISGTISMVFPDKKLLVVTTAKGVPLNFVVGPGTRIRSGEQRLKLNDLTGRVNQKVSVTFVPTRRGNLARTVEVSG